MIKKSALCAVISCALGLAAVSNDNIVKVDFENGRGIWRLPNASWKIEEGTGKNASKCLSLTVDNWQKVQWPSTERIMIEPGGAYKLEAWIDASDFHLPKGHTHLGVGFYDDNGKCVLSSIALPVADNEVRKDGWRRYASVTRTIPAAARTAGFYIWTPDGSTGVVRFDDITLSPVAAKPLDVLCVSAYRNEAVDGDVGFAAGFSVNPFKYDVRSLKADLRYMSVNGVRTVKAELRDSVASVTIPVKKFAMGTNIVTMVLRDKNGKKIDESSCRFARLSKLPKRKVSFDRYNRTLVDGKLFFPLGMYWLGINQADMNIYTNAPFNCLMPYSKTDIAQLDICEAAGIKVLFPVHKGYDELDKAEKDDKKRISEEMYANKVRKFKNHPAVLAWYLADEIREPHTYLLNERHDAIHELDADHPTWIVIYDTDHVRSFVSGYDVIGMDPYPIGGRGFGRAKIGIASGWAQQAQKRMYGFRPMWHVPQSFDWGYYRPAETNNPSVRMPDFAEMRSMTWQAVAAGANGLVFYSFHDLLKRNWPKERVAGGWENVCKVAREVKAKESVILSIPGPEVKSSTEDVVCRTWRTQSGVVHLLVCNKLDKQVKAELTIKGRKATVSLPPIELKWLTMRDFK